MMRRFFKLSLRAGAQGVPIAGVAAAGWSPAGGLILYWAESVLLLGATAILLALWARRGADPAEIARAGLRTRDVLLVHGGAFGIFGLFLAGILFILTDKGMVAPGTLADALTGLPWVALFVGVELAVDPDLQNADLPLLEVRHAYIPSRPSSRRAVSITSVVITAIWRSAA